MKEILIKTGFDNIGEVLVSDIDFHPSLIELCKMNSCGNYGKNYTCPPCVGKTEELIKKLKGFEKGIVFQKIYQLCNEY